MKTLPETKQLGKIRSRVQKGTWRIALVQLLPLRKLWCVCLFSELRAVEMIQCHQLPRTTLWEVLVSKHSSCKNSISSFNFYSFCQSLHTKSQKKNTKGSRNILIFYRTHFMPLECVKIGRYYSSQTRVSIALLLYIGNFSSWDFLLHIPMNGKTGSPFVLECWMANSLLQSEITWR